MGNLLSGMRNEPKPADVYDHIVATSRPEEAARQLADICRAKDRLVEKILKGVANGRPVGCRQEA